MTSLDHLAGLVVGIAVLFFALNFITTTIAPIRSIAPNSWQRFTGWLMTWTVGLTWWLLRLLVVVAVSLLGRLLGRRFYP